MLVLLVFANTITANEELNLPKLTRGGDSLMSDVQENALGQAWLRSFKASVPLEPDPLIFEYIENLLMKLASHSQLEDKSLDLVVVRNNTINAFAVPGGIIGVNTGLLLNAETEGQLASVLTHELAHLSQHHFARSVEAAKRASLTSMAGLLAGIVLAAVSEGDAASAAIAGSQAAALDTQLRYSRTHEQEADRLGMQTLVESGYKPSEAADMFRQMLEASRLYGRNPPEFLLTHPVTKSRVSDAENRARQKGNEGISDSLDFQLMKARAFVLSNTKEKAALEHYQHLFDKLSDKQDSRHPEDRSHTESIVRYGLALAHNQAGNWQQARNILEPLLKDMDGKIPYLMLDIEIDIKAGNTDSAVRRLRDLYALTPGSYPIGMLLAETAVKHKDYLTAEKVLTQLTEERPRQSDIWYFLAEANGLNGNIIGLHQSRAEFFLLRGNFEQAKFHLNYALKIAGEDFASSSRIRQRLRYVIELQRKQKALG